MEEGILEAYAKRFAKLNTNKNRNKWSQVTAHQAPHKPLLLLSVLDLVELGEIRSNFIEITEDLAELFGQYWERALPFSRRGNLALPFFHMQSECFWRLLPRQEPSGLASQVTSLPKLREQVTGARLDEALYNLIQVRENRNRLRSVLIETYFSPEASKLLVEQSAVNREAFIYSEELLKQPGDQTIKETLAQAETYRPAVRDQGFRRAVVTAYSHRCALCGIRVRTLDGHTAVAAAHIRPWSETYDDRPANGMSLCRLCHWTFDEGLLSVSGAYEVIASRQLNILDNLPGYLTSLEGRAIFKPVENIYWPDHDSLIWHRKHVLRHS